MTVTPNMSLNRFSCCTIIIGITIMCVLESVKPVGAAAAGALLKPSDHQRPTSSVSCPAGHRLSCYHGNLDADHPTRSICPNATCVQCEPNTFNSKDGNVDFECKTCAECTGPNVITKTPCTRSQDTVCGMRCVECDVEELKEKLKYQDAFRDTDLNIIVAVLGCFLIGLSIVVITCCVRKFKENKVVSSVTMA